MSSTPGERITSANVNTLDFGKADNLLPAVVQHADSGAVLMVGYMNAEALSETFKRQHVVFFSRSKQRLWMKGETSGHVLDLVDVRTDCDRDALLVTARPNGPVCHVGTATCFGDNASAVAPLVFLSRLEGVIEQRVAENPEGSYTARLFAKGPTRIAQKVGEEGLEVALAAVAEGDDKVVSESADLLYHLLVLLKSRGVTLAHVVAELESRHAGK
ncbi:MAG: bifunctional phosphoribosyl-AMP cyclohydrolase/phosphoribosyl-ATP diphosphatase HisIE [Gammaproteobacteria bacterium]